MPWLWQAGRSAEIEALNNLGAQIALLAIVDLVVCQRVRPHALAARVSMFHIAILGVAIAALAKGPASLPCFAGALLGCAVAMRGQRPIFRTLISPWPWIALALGAIPLGVWMWLVQARLDQTGETAIVQSADAFLWEPGRLVGIVLLAPTAFIAALPASLGVLFPFGPDARREAVTSQDSDESSAELRIARALAWSFVLSLVIFTLLGVGNVRYAMPAACLSPPLAAYVLRGVRSASFFPKRIAIARIMLLGRAEVLLTVLLIAAGVWIFAVEPKRDARSGRAAGIRTGESIASHVLASEGASTRVLADHLVEARPEVLWYAAERAGDLGVRVETVWTPGLAGLLDSLSSDALYALRQDSGEWTDDLDLSPIHTDAVHVFEFGVWTPLR
jgi:hypothetical protein